MTWLHPALSSILATSLAVMGPRLRSFLSCREYGKHGMTAVTRFADAILQALMAISSSISRSLTGSDAVWRMNTSALRTEAPMETNVSPLENRVVTRPSEPTGYPILRPFVSLEHCFRGLLSYLMLTWLASSPWLLPSRCQFDEHLYSSNAALGHT